MGTSWHIIDDFFSMIHSFCRTVGLSHKTSDRERIQQQFRHRYQAFLQLLDHNRKAHQCIADLEQKLYGDQPFHIQFVHRKTTETATAAYQMIQYLDQLNPGKFEGLSTRFDLIKNNLIESLQSEKPVFSGPYTVNCRQVRKGDVAAVGGKMANLAEVSEVLHLEPPEGFVITSSAFLAFLQKDGLADEISRMLQVADLSDQRAILVLSSSIGRLIEAADFPEELRCEILGRFDSVFGKSADIRVAVRSSAVGEDEIRRSYAGQYKSVLNVGKDELLPSCKAVIASMFGVKAITYRLNHGLLEHDSPMCVGVTRMIDAEAGGVMYSSGFDEQPDHVAVYSSWGLPRMVVDASDDVDEFRIIKEEKLTVLKKNIARKNHSYTCHPTEGTTIIQNSTELQKQPSLTDKQLFELAGIGMLCETHFHCPQDIEWAYDRGGRLHILQTRGLLQPELLDEQFEKADSIDAEVLLEGTHAASPGISSGKVFKVEKQADHFLFPDNGVLVIRQPLPVWAPLVYRAAAVVSETGSSAGHLASVTRELGIPALFGVKDGLSILNNEQIITVDSINKRIYSGCHASPARRNADSRSAFTGSPVHAALKKASKFVTPLHLYDPDSPDFQIGNCSTMHDLIRFCHEKAVEEMFTSSKENYFSKRIVRQLISGSKKQFWVLNLDDGINGKAGRKTVELDNIASIPMLALWHGMQAIPWQGPPAVNAKGLMSVMLEATSNPALDPANFSEYALKNYFMISRNYVSLQSRFGFHFCGVEALVGERAYQNYVTFHFQGGAASINRRILRAEMVGEILEFHDFRVKVYQDSLFARLEGFEREIMEEKLTMIGHLITHTRQLDMIMKDQQEVERYKKRLKEEIALILSGRTVPL